MNPITNNECDSDVSFDCSPYLSHGIELPNKNKEYPLRFHPTEVTAFADGYVTDGDEQDYNFTAAKLKQFELGACSRRSSSGTIYTEDYYPSEYSDLMACMNQSDLEDFTRTGNELNRILDISVADDELLATGIMPYGADFDGAAGAEWNQRAESPNLEELLMWKELQEKELFADGMGRYGEKMETNSPQFQSMVEEHLQGAGRFGEKMETNSPQFRSMVEEHLQGFGEKRPDHWEPPQEDQNRKRRLCRHFLKGHCKRGKACDFLHDSSIFCPNLQKVFLGGLPAHITELTLRQKLAEQGFNVINKPKVLRGFTPQVCMGSVEEARRLIEKRKILIDGSLVDVRPYEAFAKDDIDKKLPDDIKRSVFLGGLCNGTTSQMIKDDLDRMDVKVVNHPLIKTGFTPKVTLGTVEQTNMLIKLKKVRINDTLVDVRPYVNFKSPFNPSKKRY